MIHYNFAHIATAADDIERTNGQITSRLDDLKRELQPMVNEWEGESAESYKNAQKNWDDAAAQINDILAQVARSVRGANDRMSEINTNAANSWA